MLKFKASKKLEKSVLQGSKKRCFASSGWPHKSCGCWKIDYSRFAHIVDTTAEGRVDGVTETETVLSLELPKR